MVLKPAEVHVEVRMLDSGIKVTSGQLNNVLFDNLDTHSERFAMTTKLVELLTAKGLLSTGEILELLQCEEYSNFEHCDLELF